MKVTSEFINRHNDLVETYKPDAPRVGVLFVPDNYYLKYAAAGSAAEAGEGVVGYATALERLCLPYEVVEAGHLDVLAQLDVLFMPWCLVLPPATQEAILRFLQRGGRILAEAETDAFDGLGLVAARCYGNSARTETSISTRMIRRRGFPTSMMRDLTHPMA